MAWALGITDQWIQPNFSPTTGAEAPGFVIGENRTAKGESDKKIMPPGVSSNDRHYSMSDIAEYYGADKSVKVKVWGRKRIGRSKLQRQVKQWTDNTRWSSLNPRIRITFM
jgi:hypothetical protein